jgi:hypothetical protein
VPGDEPAQTMCFLPRSGRAALMQPLTGAFRTLIVHPAIGWQRTRGVNRTWSGLRWARGRNKRRARAARVTPKNCAALDALIDQSRQPEPSRPCDVHFGARIVDLLSAARQSLVSVLSQN